MAQTTVYSVQRTSPKCAKHLKRVDNKFFVQLAGYSPPLPVPDLGQWRDNIRFYVMSDSDIRITYLQY